MFLKQLAVLAQLAEHLTCNHEVSGSIPEDGYRNLLQDMDLATFILWNVGQNSSIRRKKGEAQNAIFLCSKGFLLVSCQWCLLCSIQRPPDKNHTG